MQGLSAACWMTNNKAHCERKYCDRTLIKFHSADQLWTLQLRATSTLLFHGDAVSYPQLDFPR